MQDMDVRSLAAAFFETFDGSARADLARFMARFPLTRTWLISSDYVVGADDRPNDVFAFSIMPYVEELGALRRRLPAGLPRDIKGTPSRQRRRTFFGDATCSMCPWFYPGTAHC